ncbi:Arm DNA-binding domain-containing protein [Desulfovibrio sp. JY]|nr:Arm DNA-binding domain-containing protein [Desulfovibrio sp. JY]
MVIRNAKAADKPVKLFDGAGLLLQVSPTSGKLWRFKYLFDGKEKLLALWQVARRGLEDGPPTA